MQTQPNVTVAKELRLLTVVHVPDDQKVAVPGVDDPHEEKEGLQIAQVVKASGATGRPHELLHKKTAQLTIVPNHNNLKTRNKM